MNRVFDVTKLSVSILQAIMPAATPANISKYLPHLIKHLPSIDTSERSNNNLISRNVLAAFLAQVGHESGEFAYALENLNYSAQGLRKNFPSYFRTLAIANQYARKPQAIANRVYANRMSNGPESSGDGWRFRGKGLIQLTGRANVTAFASDNNMTVDQASAFLETPEGAVLGAVWFWNENKLNRFVDDNDFIGLTRAINNGTKGLQHRTTLHNNALRVL